MKKRIALLATLAFSLVLMPGCPQTASDLAGDWVITTGVLDSGIQLNANGEAIPYLIDYLHPGTFTWEVEGTRVLFYQTSGNNKIVWAGELTSETTMNGAAVFWTGSVGSSFGWSAVKQ